MEVKLAFELLNEFGPGQTADGRAPLEILNHPLANAGETRRVRLLFALLDWFMFICLFAWIRRRLEKDIRDEREKGKGQEGESEKWNERIKGRKERKKGERERGGKRDG
ncbi:hypothetical protein EVAR_65302_1 [Eumeta japonica]|uniref:Uncharacterized protein n=1 Tax=Eumeta variegata TaxID=151549 RepID=A0A4C1YV05_EUMVA|nr:hypothetical protein EVAR_65302_1 [Eumeta japonica]